MSPEAPLHFVFVESNTTGTGHMAVERLLVGGHRVTFLARQREKYPFLASPAANLEVIALETNDAEAVARRVTEIHAHRPIDALLTFSEYYVGIVAEVAARFGFPYLGAAAAATARSKPATRQALRRAGLLTPEFHAVASLEEARRVAEGMAYPCVVKPVNESSSFGVRSVEGPEELLAQFRLLHERRENVRGQRQSGEVLVESLLTGPEYSVETWTLAPGDTRVLGVTTKHLSPPPLFVELGHDFPALVDPEVAADLTGATLAALEAVGYDFGPAHTELRLTPEGPAVVEINPRLAGGMIPELVRHSLGVDLLTALLDQLAGEGVDLTPRHEPRWTAIRFLTAPRCGRLAGARGLEEARSLQTVQEAELTKPLGIEVRPAEEATGRLGHVIAAGEDRDQVMADVAAAMDRIEVVIEPL